MTDTILPMSNNVHSANLCRETPVISRRTDKWSFRFPRVWTKHFA